MQRKARRTLPGLPREALRAIQERRRSGAAGPHARRARRRRTRGQDRRAAIREAM